MILAAILALSSFCSAGVMGILWTGPTAVPPSTRRPAVRCPGMNGCRPSGARSATLRGPCRCRRQCAGARRLQRDSVPNPCGCSARAESTTARRVSKQEGLMPDTTFPTDRLQRRGRITGNAEGAVPVRTGQRQAEPLRTFDQPGSPLPETVPGLTSRSQPSGASS